MTWQLFPATQFAQHAGAWDALQRDTTNTPFLESLFLQPLLDEFGTGAEVLALHSVDQKLTAATLLRPGTRWMWQTFQPSQLPLGPWLCAKEADLGALLLSLMHALPGVPLGLGASQLDPRLVPRRDSDPCLRIKDYIHTPFIDVEGSFATYWEARGKNLRQNTRKQRNKLQSDGTTVTLETLTDPAEVSAAMRDYGALEVAGWKAAGGTAIHADNAQGRFYTRLLQNFCAEGRGRIVRYRFGERVVAMDLCIDNGPLVVILKTAYDESFRSVSPSTLMRHDEFEQWWTQGQYKRIEFYGKTMEWHTRWTSTQRTLYHANVYRWSWLKVLHEQLQRRRPMSPTGSVSAAPAAATETA